jgi:3-oxoacyl-(acyl-carrier-protein) synthase
MTNSRQAAGNAPEGIQPTPEHCSGMITGLSQSFGFGGHNAVLILREYH